MNAKAPRTSVLIGTLKLTLFAALAALIVAGAWQLTSERIIENQRVAKIAQFSPVLAGVNFDQIDFDTPTIVEPPHTLPGKQAAAIYSVHRNGSAVARVFEVSAAGYNGPIRLLIGIDDANTVSGVRVTAHQETPGLGDNIERTRSDWIEDFNGASLQSVPDSGWQLRRNGGQFDGFTGASVTPLSIVDAVRETLNYAEKHAIAPPDKSQ